MLKKICLIAMLAAGVASTAMHAFAETAYDGETAHRVEIVSYGVGSNNDAAGVVKNPTNQTVQVTLEFKGYAADGMVSQTVVRANVDNLGPGESARFHAPGFFEHVTKVTLVKVSTSP